MATQPKTTFRKMNHERGKQNWAQQRKNIIGKIPRKISSQFRKPLEKSLGNLFMNGFRFVRKNNEIMFMNPETETEIYIDLNRPEEATKKAKSALKTHLKKLLEIQKIGKPIKEEPNSDFFKYLKTKKVKKY